MMQRRVRWRGWMVCAVLCLLLGAVTTGGVIAGAALRPRRRASEQWLEAGFLDGRHCWMFERGRSWDAIAIRVDFRLDEVSESPFRRADAGPHVIPVTMKRDPATLAFYGELAATMKQAPIDDFRDTALFTWFDAPWMEVPVLSEHPGAINVSYSARSLGWPRRAAWTSSSMTIVEQPDGSMSANRMRTGYLVGRHTALPTNFLPLGFIANTLLYAAAWWIVLVTPRGVNRWRRKRRGRCVACGYDLRGLAREAACPECGG